MYKLLLILVALSGAPEEMTLTLDAKGFSSKDECMAVGRIIAQEYVLGGFNLETMKCEPYDEDLQT